MSFFLSLLKQHFFLSDFSPLCNIACVFFSMSLSMMKSAKIIFWPRIVVAFWTFCGGFFVYFGGSQVKLKMFGNKNFSEKHYFLPGCKKVQDDMHKIETLFYTEFLKWIFSWFDIFVNFLLWWKGNQIN